MNDKEALNLFHDVEGLLAESTDIVEDRCNKLNNLIQEIIKDYDISQNEISEITTKLRDIKTDSPTTVSEALETTNADEAHLRLALAELESKTCELRNSLQQAEFLQERFDGALEALKGIKESKEHDGKTSAPRGSLQTLLALEDERKRIARDIHDGPAQNLANVVLRLDFVKKMFEKNQPQAMGELNILKDIVRDSLQDVRRFIFNLRPMSIDDLGLIPTLKRYIQDFLLRSGMEVDFVILGDEKRLPAALEISLFRIAQEALSNIMKHAKAKKVRVAVDIEDKFIMLNVKDNGRGFNLNEKENEAKKNKYESLGLVSMKERSELLGGSFSVKSTPGEGTSIIVKIPTT